MRRVAATAITLAIIAAAVVRDFEYLSSPAFVVFILPYIVSNVAVFMMLVASLRHRPQEVDGSPLTAMVAVTAATLPLILSLAGVNLFANDANISVRIAAELSQIVTIPFYLVAVFQLGSNLTVLPEANRLRTDGVYAVSRHPLYAFYIIWDINQLFICQSLLIIPVSAIQIAMQLYRARQEEAVLARVFPEYEAYAARVGWFGPIGRRRTRKTQIGA